MPVQSVVKKRVCRAIYSELLTHNPEVTWFKSRPRDHKHAGQMVKTHLACFFVFGNV